MKKYANYSLLSHNTFHFDVKATRFIEYDNVTELQNILVDKSLIVGALLHIGEGSNLLFTKDYEGTILHSSIKYYQVLSESSEYIDLRVGAGVNWDDFVRYCVENEWQGVENLSLIPGEVGASAVQNIGAYGVEVKDVIQQVETVEISTGDVRVFDNSACQYAYRQSIFKNELKGKYIITGVVFRLKKTPSFNLSYGLLAQEVAKSGDVNLQNIRNAVIAIRENKLPNPNIIGNAGSFFMNPIIESTHYQILKKKHEDIPCYQLSEDKVKVPAGWLIEKCGWKGKRVGNVGVYDKQALVLVNYGNASGSEVVKLSEQIIKSVYENFGITLFPEVNIL